MTSKIGAKEAAARAQREQKLKDQKAKKAKPLTKEQQMMIDDGLPPSFIRTGGSPKLKNPRKSNDGVTLTPPIADLAEDLGEDPMLKALPSGARAAAADADNTEGETDGPDFPDRPDTVKVKEFMDNAKSLKEFADGVNAATETTKAMVAAVDNPKKEKKVMRTKTEKKASKAKARTPVKGEKVSKTEKIAGLLKRKEGCTTADVLKATGWPAVSMPAMAKAAGLKLKKEKEGRTTRYYAA